MAGEEPNQVSWLRANPNGSFLPLCYSHPKSLLSSKGALSLIT